VGDKRDVRLESEPASARYHPLAIDRRDDNFGAGPPQQVDRRHGFDLLESGG
jgi:hypothetical protein